MTGLRLGSLCTGAGMLDLAAQAVLGQVVPVWHAETDPDASTVLSRHWPEIRNLGDLTTTDWSDVAAVDVLTAGFPCQGWSAAGKRTGSGDERDLWPVRKLDDHGRHRRGVIDAVRELAPRLVLLENVPALLTSEAGVPFGVILADLDDAGYTVAWTVVGACKVGACHHRHRLFIAAARPDAAGSPQLGRTPLGRRSSAGRRWVAAARPGGVATKRRPCSGTRRRSAAGHRRAS